MEVLSGLLSCSLWPLLCMSLGKQCNYIRKLDEHKESLRNELERLKSRGSDINDELNRGRLQHGNNPKKEVTLWLEDWQKLVNAIEIMDKENGNGMCLRGLFPNCYSRLKQSKRIEKLISEVRGLFENGQFSDGLFAASLAENQDSLPATDIHGSTAERKMVEILQCIRDPEVSKIGVYGMGGVGKTKIMTSIHNQLKQTAGEFDIVIWVTVSRSPNLEQVQDMVAKELGCNLSETSRAKTLYAAFRRRKNFLIFFDDMWDNICLEEVGIPEPNRENGSKIVWTTRFIQVCNNMESQREIKVERLLEEEAWSLFKEKVGGENVISHEIEPIAKKVAEECGGLPLALITVGRALRKTNQLEVWRSALEELRSASNYGIKDMEKEVFPRLKFSYDRLSNYEVRECFLYCAMYPEDSRIPVNELIECWMAEGLIGEVGSWEKEKDKGHAILKELKDACMIESAGEFHVKMHDLIRDLAIIITKEPVRFMVKARSWLKESPKDEEGVESLERISLMKNKIETLHGQPNCPRLLTLFLQENHCLQNISETFFKYMDNLRVLNLSFTNIESLPNALSDLTNLHSLHLYYCKKLKCLPSLAKLHKLRVLNLWFVPLEEVPHGLENLVKLRVLNLSQTEIESLPDALSDMTNLHELRLSGCRRLKCLPSLAKLHKLRVMDLSSVPLEEVPHGLENLVKLRYLNISFGGRLRSFSSGIFSKFTNLEHLSMIGSGWRWPYSNEDNKDKATVAEIISLESLTCLEAEFSDVMSFNSYSEFRRWERLVQSNFGIGGGIFTGDEHVMHLGGCDFKNVSGVKLPSIIQYLKINMCDAMEWIEECGEIDFPNLQQLELSSLLNFQGLCKQKAQQEALRNLKQMYVSDCHQLKWLIPYDLLQDNLQNLKVLQVKRCNGMEEIISCETGLDTINLPKLERLHMNDLPVLTSVCSGKLVSDFLSLIEGKKCPNLKKLPFSVDIVPPALKQIFWTEEWWNTLEWDDPHLKRRLQPFVVYIHR